MASEGSRASSAYWKEIVIPVMSVVGPMVASFILLIAVLTLLVVRPINNNIDRIEKSVNEHIDRVETSLNNRINSVESSADERLDNVNDNIGSLITIISDMSKKIP